MILQANLVDRYLNDLENRHGHEVLPGYDQALHAFRRCRNQHGRVMVLQCGDCNNQSVLPHSCDHRICLHFQHHESQQWLEHQEARLLEIDVYISTFTVPAQLRR
jgi:hypothetical protein